MAPAQYARVADAATICAEVCSALRGCSPSPAHAATADLLPSQAPANLRSVFLQPRRSLTLRHICRVTRMCERAAFAIIAATIPPALLFADASQTLSPHQCRPPCPEHFATSPSGPKAPCLPPTCRVNALARGGISGILICRLCPAAHVHFTQNVLAKAKCRVVRRCSSAVVPVRRMRALHAVCSAAVLQRERAAAAAVSAASAAADAVARAARVAAMVEGHASSFTGVQGQGKGINGVKYKGNRMKRGEDASWAM